MATRELLIMAMTHMRAGICTAGFSIDAHPQSILAWVRPVKAFGVVLLGDMTDADGRVVQVGDVAEVELTQHAPELPFVEDWNAEFVRHRPRVKRRLDGQRWADFLAAHVDRQPADVLAEPVRSLCLVRPQITGATFALDTHANTVEARLAFEVEGYAVTSPSRRATIPVTDMAWRALGRSWLRDLPEHEGIVALELLPDELQARLGFEALYLSVGRSRPYNGVMWPLVVGVHTVPNLEVTIDYEHP